MRLAGRGRWWGKAGFHCCGEPFAVCLISSRNKHEKVRFRLTRDHFKILFIFVSFNFLLKNVLWEEHNMKSTLLTFFFIEI